MRDLLRLSALVVVMTATVSASHAQTMRSSPDAGRQETGQALETLTGYLQEIQKTLKDLDNRFGYESSVKTLDRAFQDGGVEWARRYAKDWAGSVYLAMTPAAGRGPKNYLADHGDSVEKSISIIEDSGITLESDVPYFRDGMEKWRGKVKEISKVILGCQIPALVREAKILDEKKKVWDRMYEVPEEERQALREEIKRLEDKAKIYLAEARACLKPLDGIIATPVFVALTPRQANAQVAGGGTRARTPPPVTQILDPTRTREPCPEPAELGAGDPQVVETFPFNEDEARAYEEYAARAREFAQEAREQAEAYRELVQSARADGDEDLARLYETSLKRLEETSRQYEQQARDADRSAAEQRRLAEERKRRRARPANTDCDKPEEKGPKVAINEPPPPPVSSWPDPAPPRSYICGPDVTRHVLRTLRELYLDRWVHWGSLKRFAKCYMLVDVITGISAWDINALVPTIAPQSQEDFEAGASTMTYSEYLERGKFWFQKISPHCARPHPPCGSTVTFLEQCVHSQQLNYIQWGFMGKLCGNETLMENARLARNTLSRTSRRINVGQSVMIGVGRRYATVLENLVSGGGNPYDHNSVQSLRIYARTEFHNLMTWPENRPFLDRIETACDTQCTLTREEEELLGTDPWTALWGSLDEVIPTNR